MQRALGVFSISIHALLAESDWIKSSIAAVFAISIHALLAESDDLNLDWIIKALTISIHALLAESDGDPIPALPHGIQFLSTLSLRRATAPRRGTATCRRDFYPRSPCGERRTGNTG